MHAKKVVRRRRRERRKRERDEITTTKGETELNEERRRTNTWSISSSHILSRPSLLLPLHASSVFFLLIPCLSLVSSLLHDEPGTKPSSCIEAVSTCCLASSLASYTQDYRLPHTPPPVPPVPWGCWRIPLDLKISKSGWFTRIDFSQSAILSLS